MKPEREFEQAISDYYRNQGYQVWTNRRVAALEGTDLEIDVLLERRIPDGITVRIGVEAKLHSRPLDQSTYLAIQGRFRAAAVDLGLIYCPAGLQKGARILLHGSVLPRIEVRTTSYEELIQGSFGEDFLEALPRLRAAKDDQSPDQVTIGKVVRAIEALPHYSRFFFKDLTNPVWLPILAKRGVLKRSLNEANSVRSHEVSHYVRIVASSNEPEFLEFCSQISIPNGWVEMDMFAAALEVSTECRRSFMKIAAKWPSIDLMDSQLAQDLLVKEAKEGGTNAALDLLASLLRYEIKQTSGFMDYVRTELDPLLSNYVFGSLGRNCLPKLAEFSPKDVLEFSSEQLFAASRDLGGAELHEMSYLSRADISRAGPFPSDDVIDVFIDAYRDAILKATEIDEKAVNRHLRREIAKPKTGAHLRIIASVVNAAFHRLRGLCINLIAQDRFWSDYYVAKELQELIVERWQELSKQEQDAVVKRLRNPVEVELPGLSEIENVDHRERQTLDWLLCLREVDLPEDLQALRDSLSQKTGVTEPDPRSGIEVGRVDSIPDVDLTTMNVQQIVSMLRAFQPEGDWLNRKTPGGLASKLKEQVGLRPREFTDVVERLVGMPYPTYYSAFFDGWAEAIKHGRSFDVGAVTEYALAVLGSLSVAGDGPNEVRRDEFDFGSARWVRTAIARFTESAFESTADWTSNIEVIKAIHACWAELRSGFTFDTDRFGVEEVDRKSDRDWFLAVINSDNGILSMAYCRYVVKLQRLRDAKLDSQELEGLFAKALATLEDEFIPATSELIRAPLGFFFTFFYLVARPWALRNQERIFDLSNSSRWLAPWDCHFWMTKRYREVFTALEKEYTFAIKYAHALKREQEPRWAERIGDDMAIFFVDGTLPEQSSLWQIYLQFATESMLHGTTTWIGNWLRQVAADKGDLDRAWKYAYKWWQECVNRRDRIGVQPSGESHLTYFLYWLGSVPDTVTIKQVRDCLLPTAQARQWLFPEEVFKFLEERMNSEPDDAADILESMCSNPMARGGRLYSSNLAQLLGRAFELGSDEGKKKIRLAVNSLALAGFTEYADVIEPKGAN